MTLFIQICLMTVVNSLLNWKLKLIAAMGGVWTLRTLSLATPLMESTVSEFDETIFLGLLFLETNVKIGIFLISTAYRSEFRLFKQNLDGWTVWITLLTILFQKPVWERTLFGHLTATLIYMILNKVVTSSWLGCSFSLTQCPCWVETW